MGHGLVFVQTNERGYDKEALEWLKENFRCVCIGPIYLILGQLITMVIQKLRISKNHHCVVLYFCFLSIMIVLIITPFETTKIDLFYLEENLVQYQLDFISGEFLSKNDATRFDYGMFEVHRKDSKKHALTFIPKKIEGERCMWNLDRCSSGMQMKKSLWSIDGIGFSFSSLLRFDVDLCFVCGTFELFIDVIHTIFPRSCFDSSQSNRS